MDIQHEMNQVRLELLNSLKILNYEPRLWYLLINQNAKMKNLGTTYMYHIYMYFYLW